MQKAIKFTDVELSRILSAHEAGQLKRHGDEWFSDLDLNAYGPCSISNPQACLIQAAKLEPEVDAAAELDLKLAGEFDAEYNKNWSITEFIQWLNRRGCI